jgi:hypothetical protein
MHWSTYLPLAEEVEAAFVESLEAVVAWWAPSRARGVRYVEQSQCRMEAG